MTIKTAIDKKERERSSEVMPRGEEEGFNAGCRGGGRSRGAQTELVINEG